MDFREAQSGGGQALLQHREERMKTPQAARELGMTVTRLRSMIQNEKIEPPAKDTSGDFVWTAQDLERARQAALTDRRRREHRREAANVA
jgi:hypothetical protein